MISLVKKISNESVNLGRGVAKEITSPSVFFFFFGAHWGKIFEDQKIPRPKVTLKRLKKTSKNILKFKKPLETLVNHFLHQNQQVWVSFFRWKDKYKTKAAKLTGKTLNNTRSKDDEKVFKIFVGWPQPSQPPPPTFLKFFIISFARRKKIRIF